MSGAFETTLAQLIVQHKHFLSEVSGASVLALQAENQRLNGEVANLKQALRESSKGSGGGRPARAPPLPPWPADSKDQLQLRNVSDDCFWDVAGDHLFAAPLACQPPTGRRSSQHRSLFGDASGPSPRGRRTICSSPPVPTPSPRANPRVALGHRPHQEGDVDVRLLPGMISGAHGQEPRPPTDMMMATASRISALSGRGVTLMVLDDRRRTKERRRLLHLLRVGGRTVRSSLRLFSDFAFVDGDKLYSVLKEREKDLDVSYQDVAALVQALHKFEQNGLIWSDDIREHPEPVDDHVSVVALVEIIWNPRLEDYVSKDLHDVMTIVVQALRVPTIEEIIHEASRGTYEQTSSARGSTRESKRDMSWYVNFVVSTVVFVNMLSMLISVDRQPNHIGWLVFECFCTGTFVLEVLYKLVHLGPRVYFRGEQASWNIGDMVITLFASWQLSFEICNRMEIDLGQGKDIASAARSAVMLRSLRAIRVIRLVKLVKSPMLKDLANMLVGFVIGLPSLLWVLCMFVAILCMFGLFFRLMFGPTDPTQVGQYFAECGVGDDVTDLKDEACPVHLMYGEEYFGSVGDSMFTCFRFMLGDYSSRGGKSVVIAFSQHYGFKFDVVFVMWMITCIFGIFNIITAIFVDTTVAGLKHNDVKRKYAQQYERAYVKDHGAEDGAQDGHRARREHRAGRGAVHRDHRGRSHPEPDAGSGRGGLQPSGLVQYLRRR
mmetsp:Transcript_163984/g.521351  ORF Transcript_163984/g.521351 Transcript_163984/m.521351 type:complete len:719 (+) Transcript_163984:103-2259(+)